MVASLHRDYLIMDMLTSHSFLLTLLICNGNIDSSISPAIMLISLCVFQYSKYWANMNFTLTIPCYNSDNDLALAGLALLQHKQSFHMHF